MAFYNNRGPKTLSRVLKETSCTCAKSRLVLAGTAVNGLIEHFTILNNIF